MGARPHSRHLHRSATEDRRARGVRGRSEDQIAALETERERWRDPAYITTQARERLYYVKPGEVVYLIDNDLDPAALPARAEPGQRHARGDVVGLDAAAAAHPDVHGAQRHGRGRP
ncbi:MAG: septum formation initiator family protein [Candidatus Microbacterium colombiense]|nr:MAG: septum formation initiator family protein [Microbacterium sp.]